jgi:hypothetical protein
MSRSQTGLTRREVLRIAALATGALRLMPSRSKAAEASWRPSAFIQIDEENAVEVTIPRPEMAKASAPLWRC